MFIVTDTDSLFKRKKKVNGWTYVLGSIIVNRAKHCDKLKRIHRTPEFPQNEVGNLDKVG